MRPEYMDVYMPHSDSKSIGYLSVSSHRLKIQVGRALLWQVYTQQSCLTPRELSPKMAYYKDHFMKVSENGFIQRSGYTDLYLNLKDSANYVKGTSKAWEVCYPLHGEG